MEKETPEEMKARKIKERAQYKAGVRAAENGEERDDENGELAKKVTLLEGTVARLVLALDALEAKEGPAGPAGPQGPAGPEGPAGRDGQDGKDGKDALAPMA